MPQFARTKVRAPPSLCFSSCGLDGIAVFRQFLAYVNISEQAAGWTVSIQHGLQIGQPHVPETWHREIRYPESDKRLYVMPSVTLLFPDFLIILFFHYIITIQLSGNFFALVSEKYFTEKLPQFFFLNP